MPVGAQSPQPTVLPELGLMGTIPIYWGEAGKVEEVVAGQGQTHWVRARLESGYTLRPLDVLTAESLANLDFLLLAQPRVLGPAENVALDAWVRAGGRLLLFADPMLTGETRFAIGDRRRPQDVILLSPILRRWGLELQFDVDRPEGTATVSAEGVAIPVNRPGSFVVRAGEDDCAVMAGGVLAACRIGEGDALVLADAAVLDLYAPPPEAAQALDWLVGCAFTADGEIAGLAANGSAVHP